VEQPHEQPHGVCVEALGLRAGLRPTSLAQTDVTRGRSRASAPGIPESLLEGELFGYVKGSFTGQVSASPGLFEIARGGTVFLNRLERSSHAMQTRLLKVAQEGEFQRLGTRETIKLGVRIVFAMRGDPATTLSPALHGFLATRILTLPKLRAGRSIDAVLRLDLARAELDPAEAAFLRTVHELALKRDPVLLVGEYKDAEAVARALHSLGRRTGQFIQEEFSGPEPTAASSAVDGLNARQRKVIEHLRAHGSIGPRAYCEMVGVSATTGARDLKKFVQLDLLEIVGKGRTAAYALKKAAQP
jgi:transcriptional regulator of acetoin/glycerol metabolism